MSDIKEGDRVRVLHQDALGEIGVWAGTVEKKNDDGTYKVKMSFVVLTQVDAKYLEKLADAPTNQ